MEEGGEGRKNDRANDLFQDVGASTGEEEEGNRGVRLGVLFFFFFFKPKTAYEIGTGDWSSDVCSDLPCRLYFA